MWERVAEVWNDTPAEVCQNLIESMPRRIDAVIKAKGAIQSTRFTITAFLIHTYKIDKMSL